MLEQVKFDAYLQLCQVNENHFSKIFDTSTKYYKMQRKKS